MTRGGNKKKYRLIYALYTLRSNTHYVFCSTFQPYGPNTLLVPNIFAFWLPILYYALCIMLSVPSYRSIVPHQKPTLKNLPVIYLDLLILDRPPRNTDRTRHCTQSETVLVLRNLPILTKTVEPTSMLGDLRF